MLAIVFDNWLEIWFLFLVSRVQVARLACVLIGSLAKLLSSFCKQSVLVPGRWLMLSSARWSHQWLLFGFKGPLQYPTLSWLSTKNEVVLQLTILVVLNRIWFWIKPFAYGVCCTWPCQVQDRTFLLSESYHTQLHQVLNRTFAIRVLLYSTASGPE